ncbi:2858_t:CDS:2 [Funneliformis caledonium]|uniref:2858_t:CDS:1 n=1 Tax=Funneliformis caledonium TaxID=1117310 RepID=A0A9N9GGA9_9GLOM|nr:2858_t:CDS:2 [Funneliformis caledonium]
MSSEELDESAESDELVEFEVSEEFNFDLRNSKNRSSSSFPEPRKDVKFSLKLDLEFEAAIKEKYSSNNILKLIHLPNKINDVNTSKLSVSNKSIDKKPAAHKISEEYDIASSSKSQDNSDNPIILDSDNKIEKKKRQIELNPILMESAYYSLEVSEDDEELNMGDHRIVIRDLSWRSSTQRPDRRKRTQIYDNNNFAADEIKASLTHLNRLNQVYEVDKGYY